LQWPGGAGYGVRVVPVTVAEWCRSQLPGNATHIGRSVWGVGLGYLVAGTVGLNPASGMDVCLRPFMLCFPVRNHNNGKIRQKEKRLLALLLCICKSPGSNLGLWTAIFSEILVDFSVPPGK
jgi:hypothetical protein